MINKTYQFSSFAVRPPIVTILGHVDHGKTTLLDRIRKTNVAQKEFGGITQHISAYQVELPSTILGKKSSSLNKITFIDTPGHAAFAKMRNQGVKVADIAILVVSATDGVMPQTVESIEYIKETNLPCIVVLNKIDLPGINLDKIKKQLTKYNLQLEEYGGEIPVIPLSAKTGEGIDKLLQMILFLAEYYQIKEKNHHHFEGIILEATLSKNRGPCATVIIKNGSLSVGETIMTENQKFKVRALRDWLGNNLYTASAGMPVEILGWKNIPNVGSVLYKEKETNLSQTKSFDHDQLTINSFSGFLNKNKTQINDENKIKLIVKADSLGTLEAVISNLKNNPEIQIITGEVGDIKESDVFLAKTLNAIIIGFHLKIKENILKMAKAEKVLLKTYHIIYELFDELKEVIEAIREGKLDKILGEAKIIATFRVKDQTILGIKVTSGRIARGDQVKLLHDGKEIGRTRIKSLRHGKENINSTSQGTEAGLTFYPPLDFSIGDSIIAIG